MLLKNSVLVNLKRFVIKNVRFRSVLWKILYFIYGFGMPRLPRISIDKALDLYSHNNKSIFFVEIGANDGVSEDPLRKYIIRDQWSGILVEPAKHAFELLKANYQGYNNLIFENGAITDKEEVRSLYMSSKDWGKVCASLSLDLVLATSKPGLSIEKDLIVEKVQCLTLARLLEKHRVAKVDLLMIDAEGCDYEIIKTINFNKIQPLIIIFERNNLSIIDFRKSISCLLKNGYKLYKEGINVVAIKDPNLIKAAKKIKY